MTIHEFRPGIEVTIEVDNATLREYSTSNDETEHKDDAVRLHQACWTVTNYVESVTSKHFSIKAHIHSDYEWDCPRLGFAVYADGVKVRETVFTRPAHGNQSQTHSTAGMYYGYSGEPGIFRKFTFAEIHPTSEDVDTAKIREDKVRLSKVGEIMVMVHRYRAGPASTKRRRYKGGKDLNDEYDSAVHEKALKGEAKSHGVSLGAAENIRLPKKKKHLPLDGTDYPIAIFKFKYRSNEALKQLRIVERTPEPEDSPLSDLIPEERKQVEEFARKLRNKRAKSESNVSVKLEDEKEVLSPGTCKLSKKNAQSNIIDLTAD